MTMTAYNALKKVRKNIKKEFDDVEVLSLHKILSKNDVKETIKILDVLSAPLPHVLPEDGNMRESLESVVEALHVGPLSADPNDVEANEMLQLLSGIHWKSFADAYTEIATKSFYMPELPDTAISLAGFGPYGTMNSLMNSRGSLPFHTVEFASQPKVDGLAGSYGQLVAPESAMADVPQEPRKTEATLTGGGGGLNLPPIEGTARLVSFEKNYGEDLGFTVVPHQYMSAHYGLVKELVIKRILAASRIERHGLLHEGDVIRELNGVPVDTPQALQRLFKRVTGTVTLKVISGYQPPISNTQNYHILSDLFLKTYFSYNPKNDNLIPCKEGGLVFHAGDILQVLRRDDPNWWQARHYGHQQRAGLIPSAELQERRKAFTLSKPNSEELTQRTTGFGLARSRKKKVVVPFRVSDAELYETKDLVLYEEVALISGFQRPVVCLVGAPGVGRRAIRNMLLQANPERYASPVRHTSRQVESDEEEPGFIVDTAANMELDKLRNQYLEFGEYKEHFYGTKLGSIRDVVKSGRTCLLTCSAQAVSRIRNSEFMPYVILLAAPSFSCMKAMYEYGMSMGFAEKCKRDENFRRTLDASVQLEQNYRHLFDKILLCDNIESTFEQLSQCLTDILVEPQWVPAKWLY